MTFLEIAQMQTEHRIRKSTVSALARRYKVSWGVASRALNKDLSQPAQRKPRGPNAAMLKRRKAVRALALRRKTVKGRSYPVFCSAAEICAQLPVKVSAKTVFRDLKALGFASRVRCKVPTREPSTIAKRQEFCAYWSRRTAMSERIVFSDEHTVSINDHSRRRMWVAPGDRIVPRERRRLQNIPRVMVWAAVGIEYKSPIIQFPLHQQGDKTKGFRLNAEGYVRRCLSAIVPSLLKERRIFQQDGAKAHQNNKVRAYLKRKKVVVMDPWPAYSPDLNMIELLWPLLNQRVAALRPTDQDSLAAAIDTAWAGITQAEINARCKGFMSRVKAVLGKNGEC